MIIHKKVFYLFFQKRAIYINIFWMVLSTILFAMVGICIRYITDQLHPLQAVFIRNVIDILVLLPLVCLHWIKKNRSYDPRWAAITWRSLFSYASMLTWFFAISGMPIAEAMALSFTKPIFATLAAILLFHEASHLRRWIAIALGFVGVAVILDPQFGNVMSDAAWVALLSSAFSAAVALLLKRLSQQQSILMILFRSTLIMSLVGLIPALYVWEPITVSVGSISIWQSIWGWIILDAILAIMAQFAFTKSLQHADLTAVLPFDFLRLPFAATLAWLFFAESIKWQTVIGASIIFGSSLFIAYRETKLESKKRKTALTGGSKADPVQKFLPTD